MELFKDYSYVIRSCLKKNLKKELHKKYKYKRTMSAIL